MVGAILLVQFLWMCVPAAAGFRLGRIRIARSAALPPLGYAC
jgi:P pilus assembly chaperone PapD